MYIYFIICIGYRINLGKLKHNKIADSDTVHIGACKRGCVIRAYVAVCKCLLTVNIAHPPVY